MSPRPAVPATSPRISALVLVLVLGLLAAAPYGSAANAAGSAAPTPTLTLERLIQTTPFAGSSRSMQDNEGSAYVAADRQLWMVDDEGQRIFAVDARSGELERTIGPRALSAVQRFGGSAKAGSARSRDLESAAYDAARDRLYVFSGSDCWPSAANCRVASEPTVFRLDRRAGRLRLHSYQPLPAGTNANAAAWNPEDRRTYVGDARTIRRYDYRRNRQGPPIQVAGLVGLQGMDFTGDGSTLMVTHDGTMLSRVDWASRSLVAGWPVDLSPLQVRDPRAVEVVGGRLLVSDGADDRTTSSTYRYAVFVLDATG